MSQISFPPNWAYSNSYKRYSRPWQWRSESLGIMVHGIENQPRISVLRDSDEDAYKGVSKNNKVSGRNGIAPSSFNIVGISSVDSCMYTYVHSIVFEILINCTYRDLHPMNSLCRPSHGSHIYVTSSLYPAGEVHISAVRTLHKNGSKHILYLHILHILWGEPAWKRGCVGQMLKGEPNQPWR